MTYEDAVKTLLHLNTLGALIEGETKDEERAEAISMAIQALRSCHEQEPLSEEIEKKAKAYAKKECPNPDLRYFYEQAYIAGAMEMASQGVTVEGLVVCNEMTHGYKDIVMSIPKSLNVGDKVILTIRKVNRKTNTDAGYLCWNDMTDKQKSDFLYELSHQPVTTPDEDLPVHKS